MTQDIMDKADTALASARLLLDAGDSDGASNRAYYAMFDATIAALIWAGAGAEGRTPRTHSGLIGAFGQHLVQAALLPAEFGRSLNRVHELRLTGDYLAAPVPTDKAEWAVQEAEGFVAGVRHLLTKPKI